MTNTISSASVTSDASSQSIILLREGISKHSSIVFYNVTMARSRGTCIRGDHELVSDHEV